MNILQKMGGQILWAGTGDSMMSLIMNMLPEQFNITMAHAKDERERFLASRSVRRDARASARASIQAALKATGTEFKILDVDEEDEDEMGSFGNSAPLTKIGNGVGMISIKGSLVNDDAWYLKYFGEVGYPHIQDSIMAAYGDPSITSVLLDVDSPGGAVSGISETVDAIRALDTFKPVSTFAGGQMLSGGMWLGSAAPGGITAGSLTQAGSIGVLMNHMDYSRMLAEKGIDVTVLRKGEFKALMTPYEPLSQKAKDESAHAMDVIYDAFTASVATGRKTSQANVQNNMGEGKVFWGPEAQRVGLVDKIGTVSDAVANSAQLADTRAQQASGVHQRSF